MRVKMQRVPTGVVGDSTRGSVKSLNSSSTGQICRRVETTERRESGLLPLRKHEWRVLRCPSHPLPFPSLPFCAAGGTLGSLLRLAVEAAERRAHSLLACTRAENSSSSH